MRGPSISHWQRQPSYFNYGDTAARYLSKHHRIISRWRRWGYQVSSNPIASLQIHGTAVSRAPLLVSPYSQQIELRALQRFAFEQSRHRLLREEPELRNLQPHERPRVEYILLLTIDCNKDWTGTISLIRYDHPWYPWLSYPQLSNSPSTPSNGFRQRRPQVVAISPTTEVNQVISRK